MLQDRQGFLWLGTQDGLNRYDGYEFRVYKRDLGNHDSLPANFISALAEDHDGYIWVGTFDSGLARYDPRRDVFKTYRHTGEAAGELIDNRIRALQIDGEGRLWIGTLAGLQRYDAPSERFVTVGNTDDNRLTNNQITGLSLDGAAIIVGTRDGLNRVATSGDHVEQLSAPDGPFARVQSKPIRSLYVDSRSRIWVGGLGIGLLRYDPATREMCAYRANNAEPHALPHDSVHFIFEDKHDNIWVGTYSGLAQYDAGQDRFNVHKHIPGNKFSIANNYLSSVYQDDAGVLWFGTWTGGVSRIDVSALQFSEVTTGEFGSMGLVEDAQGHIWYASNDGVYRWDRSGGERLRVAFDSATPNAQVKNDITQLQLSRDGTAIWVASLAGLHRLDLATREIHALGLPDTQIYTLYEDSGGALWVGAAGAGLYRIDATSGGILNHHELGRIASIGEFDEGLIWAGSSSGLYWFDIRQGKSGKYQYSPDQAHGISHTMVTWMLRDSAGDIWLGTQAGGINKMMLKDGDPASAHFQAYTSKDGLAADAIGAILEDARGDFWISTTRGISRFDRAAKTFRNYGDAEGARSGSYFVGSGLKGRDGLMYFGGPHGVTFFDPLEVRDSDYQPPVLITEFTLFNQPLRTRSIDANSILEQPVYFTREVTLQHAQSVFGLGFAALHYSESSKNRYAYKLSGFDQRWNDVDASRRFVTYTNLEAGDYMFTVRGSNKDGIWSKHQAELRIRVLPPWWQTLWARIGFALLLFATAYFAYAMRVRRMRLTAMVLRRKVAEKTQSLEEANRKLEAAARTDFLTSLPNRRELMERGQREFDRGLRYGSNCCVILADLDLFKEINDGMGHDAGDKVLREVASVFNSNIRGQDVVGRWGGEEFLFILPDTDIEGGRAVANNVARRLRATPFEIGGRHITVTATFGVSALDPQLDLEVCIDQADQAMYAGKRQGRDRVVVSGEA